MQFTELTLYAGATWSFSESLSEYPASEGWALVITLQHSTDTATTLTSTASGDDFSFEIDATTTSAYTKRNYKYQAVLSKSGEVAIYENGNVEIFPLLTIAGDHRTHNEIMLDAIIASLEGRATREQKSIKFADREIEYLSLEELINAKKYYARQVAKEKNISEGKSSVPRILERY